MKPSRIVVPLAGSPALAAETIDSVVRHAAGGAPPLVIGGREELSWLRERPSDLAVEMREAKAGEEGLRALPALLREHPGHDLLVISPGTVAVPLFDLQLAWTAEAIADLGAVSPLRDTATAGAGGATIDLDRRMLHGPTPLFVDAPRLWGGCFFLRWQACPELPDEAFCELGDLEMALRRRGRSLALAPRVVVGSLAGERQQDWRPPAIDEAMAARRRGGSPVPEVRRGLRPRVLHVTHSLGGGLDRWVREFASVDERVESWVLRSLGARGSFGSELWLFDDVCSQWPRRIWKLANPIAHTAIRHLDYRRVLHEIVGELGVEAVIVSSLIGHSLDALRTGAKTAFIAHDYYPFCSALHIYFGGICESCTPARLQRCRDENRITDLFDEPDAAEWLALRDAFFATLLAHQTRLVAPSPSVERNYRRLAPGLASKSFVSIEHSSGSESLLGLRERRQPRKIPDDRPLRAVILGRFSAIKGADLIARLLPALRGEVEISLVGCGEDRVDGVPPNVVVIPEYEPAQLAAILDRLDPDLALLLSIVPETFSFTLGECFAAGLPVLATRVGSFEDRIVDGVTGFLAEPSAKAVAERLRQLSADRSRLAEVEHRLATVRPRTPAEMVGDYADLLDLPELSGQAFRSAVAGAHGAGEWSAGGEGVWLPPSSPLGFRDFLARVEKGTRQHVRTSGRLRPWQRRGALALVGLVFGTLRRLLRWL